MRSHYSVLKLIVEDYVRIAQLPEVQIAQIECLLNGSLCRDAALNHHSELFPLCGLDLLVLQIGQLPIHNLEVSEISVQESESLRIIS